MDCLSEAVLFLSAGNLKRQKKRGCRTSVKKRSAAASEFSIMEYKFKKTNKTNIL